MNWAIWPSITCEAKYIKQWQARGFRVAVMGPHKTSKADLTVYVPQEEFKSTANGYNQLILRPELKHASTVVLAADDVNPDPDITADDIDFIVRKTWKDGFGVIIPRGDSYGDAGVIQHAIMGGKFARTINRGQGPYHSGYRHYFADKELFDIVNMLGCGKETEDINLYHDHWLRKDQERPKHLHRWQLTYNADQLRYETRKKQGFPGHEPVREKC